MSWLFGGSTTEENDQKPDGRSYISILTERLKSSHIIDDRRDAVRNLRGFSRKYKTDIVDLAFETLVVTLKNDMSDTELVGIILDIFNNLIETEANTDHSNHEDQIQILTEEKLDEIASTMIANCAAITPQESVLSIILELLSVYEFNVRFPTVKFITQLLRLKKLEVQSLIMSQPMGISSLVDILQDQMEPIRNEGILTMIELSKDSQTISKMVVFADIYEILLNIIEVEGFSEGYVVVSDCLSLLLQLLQDNSSNISFFRENRSFIPRICSFFDTGRGQSDDEGQGGDNESNQTQVWTDQKITNIVLMLSVIRSLVSPSLPKNEYVASQDAVKKCGLFTQLCGMLMAHGIPAQVLAETICTVGDCARGNAVSQDYLMTLSANAFNPPRPLIFVLLMSMINEGQPMILRAAILYCFQALHQQNISAQAKLVSTLLPQSGASANQVNMPSIGQLLCSGFFSQDPNARWLSAIALAHGIADNDDQKENLLRVQLTTGKGSPPTSLLQQCSNSLITITTQGQGQPIGSITSRLALLQFLINWLYKCPAVVTNFVKIPTNISFLISQLEDSHTRISSTEKLFNGLCSLLLGSCIVFNENDQEIFDNDQEGNINGNPQPCPYSSEKIMDQINNRIGQEKFLTKLTSVAQTKEFSSIINNHDALINLQQSEKLLLDRLFCTQVRKIELAVVARFENGRIEQRRRSKERDEKMEEVLKNEIENLQNQLESLNKEITELTEKNEKLTEERENLAEQNSHLVLNSGENKINNENDIEDDEKNDIADASNLVFQLKAEIKTKNQEISDLKSELLNASNNDDMNNEFMEENLRLIAEIDLLKNAIAESNGNGNLGQSRDDGEVERLRLENQNLLAEYGLGLLSELFSVLK